MFTNWLTPPITTTTSNHSSNMDSITSTATSAFPFSALSLPLPMPLPFPQPPPATLPPNVLIEVGPPPFTRFAAHSALLSGHSGYLRAAIRSTEDINMDLPIFLPNITAEQFTPLLTYMYTGFLDLNIDNIFGVLLATHVLHMPRALEICRNYLSSQSADNYEARSHLQQLQQRKENTENCKVIRPIASKASAIGLNFIAPPSSNILLASSTDTPFKSFMERNTVPKCVSPKPSTSGASAASFPGISNGSASTKKMFKVLKNPIKTVNNPKPITAENTSENILNNAQNETSMNDSSKVIIDIASCDGPVRFSRVLNDAYGFNNVKNTKLNNNNNTNNQQPQQLQTESNELLMQKRSHHVNTSFHQQMVRNINEQRFNKNAERTEIQLYQSEDSEDNSQDQNQNTISGPKNQSTSSNHSQSGEIYNCVYCKHTFKSQYCYQKHAKRHLNPLNLGNIEMAGTCSNSSDVGTENTNNELIESNTVRMNNIPSTHSSEASTSGTIFVSNTNTAIASNDINTATAGNNKREVKPLDMNVQYYPCKTCGSKFPSYYFVHKHRKLCHADEEN